MKYGYTKKVDLTFDDAVAKVTDELKKVGFGVLTSIDVKKTMKEKIDVDRRPYVILGACNPHFANQALNLEETVGLLMPCNVIVFENENKEIMVSSVEVNAMMSVIERDDFNEFTTKVNELLHTAIDQV